MPHSLLHISLPDVAACDGLVSHPELKQYFYLVLSCYGNWLQSLLSGSLIKHVIYMVQCIPANSHAYMYIPISCTLLKTLCYIWELNWFFQRKVQFPDSLIFKRKCWEYFLLVTFDHVWWNTSWAWDKEKSSEIFRSLGIWLGNTQNYYMAVSHKDWELPNSQIWLAEIDIESGLDFPI